MLVTQTRISSLHKWCGAPITWHDCFRVTHSCARVFPYIYRSEAVAYCSL